MNADVYLSHPQPYVADLLRWRSDGRLLDVGAGWGRNARYFAEHGFAVTAVEHTPDAIARLQTYNASASRTIEIIASDLRGLRLTAQYDVVLCTMVLHFLSTEMEIAQAIALLQGATTAGGINVVSLYTSRNSLGLRPCLASPGTLAAAYRGWSQLDYYEGPGRWYVPPMGGSKRRHYVERMTARKSAQARHRVRDDCTGVRHKAHRTPRRRAAPGSATPVAPRRRRAREPGPRLRA